MKKILPIVGIFLTATLFAAIPDLLPGRNIWSGAYQLHPGIIHKTQELKVPRLMRVQMVRIDLKQRNLKLVTNLADKDAGKPMPDFPKNIIRTKRMTVNAFIDDCWEKRNLEVIFAVNAAPWSPWTTPYTHKYADNMGLLVSEGKVICPPNGRPSLTIDKYGRADIQTFKTNTKPKELTHLQLSVTGFSIVLKDGNVTGRDNTRDLHPRMGYGLSADKRYLYIVAVDGRQPEYSLGASTYEIGQFLKVMGAADGLNMDGGGSTTMVNVNTRKGNQLQMLNRPSEGGKYQRPVGCALGVYFDVPRASRNKKTPQPRVQKK